MNRIDEIVRSALDDHADDAPAAAPVVTRVLDRRTRRPRGWLVAGAAAAAVVAIVGIGVGVTDGPGSAPGPSEDPTVADQPSVVDSERMVAIYSVAIERFLHESRDGFPDGGPDRVFVAIRPERDAGWATGQETGDPLPPETRDALSAKLAPVTELIWVEELPVSGPDQPPGQAKAAMTLGLLPAGDDQVKVSLSAAHGFNNAWLNTYVVTHTDSGWRVTGTDAPVGLT